MGDFLAFELDALSYAALKYFGQCGCHFPANGSVSLGQTNSALLPLILED